MRIGIISYEAILYEMILYEMILYEMISYEIASQEMISYEIISCKALASMFLPTCRALDTWSVPKPTRGTWKIPTPRLMDMMERGMSDFPSLVFAHIDMHASS